jgi:hypothetical protein
MSSSRRTVVCLIAAVIASTWGCADSSTGTQATPASLNVASGNAQTGSVGVQLAIPLTVVVTNANGGPVAGTAVRFQVTEGSGTVSPAVVTTDANGNASTQLTLGSDAGTVRVTATVQGTSLTTTFLATAFVASSDCTTPISLAVGQVTTAINGGSVCIAPTASAADYLLVPFFASSVSSARTTISVTAAGTSAPSASLDMASISPSLSRSVGIGSLADATTALSSKAFELALRERERRELAPLIPAARAWRRSAASSGALRNSIPNTVAVGDLVQLNANANVACSQPNIRGGRVVAITAKAIVVADTLNPTGGFTNAEYQSIGVTFDTLVDPLDTRYFGAPSDIDNNGRVVIFFTKAVNDLTPASSSSYVGGFFFARDLFPLTSTTPAIEGCPTSNVGEMFYAMVPDAARSSAFSKTNVTRIVISTLGHEYQHLINAARRLYVNTGADDFEEVWLNEGLSHVAEELLFYESSKLQPRANIDVTTIRRSQAYVDAFNNFNVANVGRYESYLESPSDYSPFADNDSLETRGATWSFLRYAADHRATSDGDVWFKLVNSTTTGIANLNQVLGTNALAVARNWSVAVATDDLAGFAPSYQQPSWNFRDILATLRSNTAFPLATRTLATAAPTSVTLVAGGSAYLRFGATASSSPTISWTSPNASVQFALARTK